MPFAEIGALLLKCVLIVYVSPEKVCETELPTVTATYWTMVTKGRVRTSLTHVSGVTSGVKTNGHGYFGIRRQLQVTMPMGSNVVKKVKFKYSKTFG